jgi:hypothetical protein
VLLQSITALLELCMYSDRAFPCARVQEQPTVAAFRQRLHTSSSIRSRSPLARVRTPSIRYGVQRLCACIVPMKGELIPHVDRSILDSADLHINATVSFDLESAHTSPRAS